jgi:hypothetical protein
LFIQGFPLSFLGRISGSRPVLLPALALSALLFIPSAFAANITVASPVNGTAVSSPVWVRAHNVGCNGLTPTAFVYSVDNSPTLAGGVTINDIDTTTAMSAGTHTIHYKSWVSSGECPSVSTTFTVTGGSSGGSSGSPTPSSPPTSGTGITVTSPVNGASGLSSPIWVRAHNASCNGKATTSFDYSIDNNPTLFAGSVSDINATGVAIGSGTHTIHFKAWTGPDICPVVSSTFTVGGSGSSGGTSSGSGSGALSSLPSNAVGSANLDGLSAWADQHDTGTPGSSSGSMVYPATTPSYDDARELYMTYSSG